MYQVSETVVGEVRNGSVGNHAGSGLAVLPKFTKRSGILFVN